MDIPRGHAAMPLQEGDFLDFIYNYFKAEYAPIKSFWSTATAFPLQPHRWINMGHELSPLSVRPANAQAQKDLESFDYFTRKSNLDAGFVRGLVIRYAKYEVHDRLEKKLFECARLDLMVRKSLKEKHLIDSLWPSPAPKNLPHELLQQGVQVRKWYGDMFTKYFRVLHSLDSFELRPEIDARIKNSGTLMLVPFVDHLVFGDVQPILPIVAKGAGYSNAKGWEKKNTPGFGEPGRFEIRFDSPADITDTYTKSVVRQCQCMKCGTKRDVQVVISVDPNPNGGAPIPAATSKTVEILSGSSRREQPSKAAHRYSPGYQMPGKHDTAPRKSPRPQQPETPRIAAPRPSSPERKKQCPRCTFLNHIELTACEICQADLPDVTITNPPSPATVKKSSHSHSASLPPPSTGNARQETLKAEERPAPPNRNSLSSSLFSIFPFSQQHQQEHHAKLPPTQQTDTAPAVRSKLQQEVRQVEQRPSSKAGKAPIIEPTNAHPVDSLPQRPSTPPSLIDHEPESHLSRAPEMAMMPMTPPPTSSASKRPAPVGLPSNLMDDFVPVSPAYAQDDDDGDAGWGEMSREEARGDSSDEEEVEGRNSGGLIDLDAVAREEADVWGERED